MAANDSNVKSGGNPLARAADRIREAAKWLIVSFAAVGVTLYGGLQLASIGKLSSDEPARLAAAGIGIFLGLVGLTIAIAAASSVVTKSYASLRWLRHLPPADSIRMNIEGDRSLLGGYENLDRLACEIESAQQRRQNAYEARYAPEPANETADQRNARAAASNKELELAEKWTASLKNIEANVLNTASFIRVASAYEKARRAMFAGAGIAAIGIALFAWGANPPQLITAEQILPPAPSDVTIIVAPSARDIPRPDLGGRSLQQLLGKGCDLSAVQGIAVGAEGSSYQVVSIRTQKCSTVFFRISPSQGRLVPRTP